MKKRILSLLLSLTILLSCLPIGVIASASEGANATAQKTYTFSNQKKGIHFYSLGMPNNYDSDGDGTVSSEESLAELEALLEAGYFNEMFLGSLSEEVLALMREYNITFWYMPGNWKPETGTTLGGYLQAVHSTVTKIKNAGAWDLFNGFHWDEPLGAGMTNENLREITKYLSLAYHKRNYIVFSSYLLSEANRAISTVTDKENKELVSSVALEYLTDVGWDTYTYDVRTNNSTASNQNLKSKLQLYSSTAGKTISSVDELYRDTHANLMSKVNHPINVWFYVCAYNCGPFYSTSGTADEGYCTAQLEYYDALLDETTAQYEYQRSGGLAIYTYQSDKYTGLSKRLPITVNGTTLYNEGSYATKWTDFDAKMKAIKTKYDGTASNEICTGIENSLSSGLNDGAYYIHDVPDKETNAFADGFFQYSANQTGLTLRHEDNENFYVIDPTKINTTATRYSELKIHSRIGIDETIDTSKINAIAVRIKINDNSPVYSYKPANFELMLYSPNGDGLESDDFWRANQSRNNTYTPMWLDLEDGTLTKMYASSGNATSSIFQTVGSMNGYMIIPIEAFTNGSTRLSSSNERFTDLLRTVRVVFSHNPDSESARASVWEDKEFLFGDCFLIEDIDTFASVRSSGITKYNSGKDDGAYLAQKIPNYKTVYGGGENSTLYVAPLLAKSKSDPSAAQNDYTGYLHIVKLDESRNAIEAKVNGSGNVYLIARNYDTYQGQNPTGYYKDAVLGTPASITSLGIKGLATRVVITGNEGKTAKFALAATIGTDDLGNCYYKTNVEGAKVYFIDAKTGDRITYTTTSKGIEVNGNLDGWFVVPSVDKTSWSGLLSSDIANNVSGIGAVLYDGGWDDSKAFYLSDSYWLTDVEKFMDVRSIKVSLDKVSVGKTSITIPKQDDAVYSLDGATWDNGEGSFTGLESYKEYTVYAKEVSTGYISTRTFKTLSAIDTERGDGSYYYYDFDTPAVGSTITYGQYSKVGSLRDSYATNGYLGPYKTGYYLYVENINGEGMLRLDHNEEDTRTDENLMIYLSKVNESTPVDIKSYVDTDPLTHFAIRVKISGGTKGNVSAFNLSFFDAGITPSDLSNIRLIDYDTKTVIDPKWTNHFTFTDEFNGWIVVPFDAYATRTVSNSTTGESETLTGKEQILGLSTITPKPKYTVPSGLHLQFHLGCTAHGLDEGNGWDNRVLNFGDVVVLEDVNKFMNVNTVGVNLEDITVSKNSITVSKQANAVFSLDGKTWDNGEGVFTGLTHNTTYTVYAKNTTIGTVISKEVKTLDVDITLDDYTVTNSSITIAEQDDAVYSLDGIEWDNGEGVFENLKGNTTYTVYAKELSSGIIISKEITTNVSVVTLDNVSVGKTTITAQKQLDAVFSLDTESWDNGEGVFTGLTHNTTYTIYAKNLSNGEIISKEVTTLNVDITLNAITITNRSIILEAQDDAVYSLDGINWDNGEGVFENLNSNTTYTVYAKEVSSSIVISNEFKTDISVVTLDNVTVGKTTITAEAQYDAVFSLDGVSWDNGEGVFEGLTYNTVYTIYAKNLSNGEIISKEVTTLNVGIAINAAIITNKTIIIESQDDAVYSLDGIDWDNGEGVFENLKGNTTYTVYAKEVSSSIIISKEITTEVSVVTLDNVTVGKTSITAEKQHDAIFSLDNENWDNGEGVFEGLTHNTVYTIYANNLSTGEVISKEVTTLDIGITINATSIKKEQIVIESQDDAVYSLDGKTWDDGEGVFTNLKADTVYTVYAKEVSSGIIISKQFRTLATDEGDPIETPQDFLCEINGHQFTDATCTAPKTCTLCGATEGEAIGHIFDNDKDADCNVCGFVRDIYELGFSGASLTLENNTTINFKADKNAMDNAGFTSPVATFVFEEKTITVDGVDSGDGKYVFAFKNITPDKIGQTVYATLSAQKDGETVTSAVTIEYSVKTYCYNMLSQYADYTDEKSMAFKTLLVDLLYYGSAAQLYVDSEAENLVSDALTNEQKGYATENITLDAKGEFIGDKGSVVWESGALVLEDIVLLRYKFSAQNVDGFTVKISDGGQKEWTVDKFFSAGDGEWYVYFNGLFSNELRTPLYLTIYDADGNQVSNTLKYGVDTYASRMQDKPVPGLTDLVVNLMKYGDSAERYCNIK